MSKRTDPLLKTFGWRVRHLRDAKRWTQEVLAERADLDRSYIAGIEAGLRNPSLKAIAQIARGLNMSLEHLFEHVTATEKNTCGCPDIERCYRADIGYVTPNGTLVSSAVTNCLTLH